MKHTRIITWLLCAAMLIASVQLPAYAVETDEPEVLLEETVSGQGGSDEGSDESVVTEELEIYDEMLEEIVIDEDISEEIVLDEEVSTGEAVDMDATGTALTLPVNNEKYEISSTIDTSSSCKANLSFTIKDTSALTGDKYCVDVAYKDLVGQNRNSYITLNTSDKTSNITMLDLKPGKNDISATIKVYNAADKSSSTLVDTIEVTGIKTGQSDILHKAYSLVVGSEIVADSNSGGGYPYKLDVAMVGSANTGNGYEISLPVHLLTADDINYTTKRLIYNTVSKRWEGAILFKSMPTAYTLLINVEGVCRIVKGPAGTGSVPSDYIQKADCAIKDGTLTISGTGELVVDGVPVWKSLGGTFDKVVTDGPIDGVTTVAGLFKDCTNLVEADLSGINFADVTDMSDMFNGCSNLKSVNIAGNVGDAAVLTKADNMFKGCSKLLRVDLSKHDFSKVTSAADMFAGCTILKEIKTPKNVTVDIALPSQSGEAEWKAEGGSDIIGALPKSPSTSATIARTVKATGLRISTMFAEEGNSRSYMYVGEEGKIVTAIEPEGLDNPVTYRSSDSSVVSVSGSGDNVVIKALKAGTATITATCDKKEGEDGGAESTLSFTVKDPYAPASIQVKATLSGGIDVGSFGFMYVGDTAELSAEFRPYMSSCEVEFSSSDESIVSVSGTRLTAKAAGTATITAKSKGLEKEIASEGYAIKVKAVPGGDDIHAVFTGDVSDRMAFDNDKNITTQYIQEHTVLYDGKAPAQNVKWVPSISTTVRKTRIAGTKPAKYKLEVTKGAAQYDLKEGEYGATLWIYDADEWDRFAQSDDENDEGPESYTKTEPLGIGRYYVRIRCAKVVKFKDEESLMRSNSRYLSGDDDPVLNELVFVKKPSNASRYIQIGSGMADPIKPGSSVVPDVKVPQENDDLYAVGSSEFLGDLSKAVIADVTASYTYDGKEKLPTPKVTITGDNGKTVTLRRDSDYRLVYTGNINAGENTATVQAVGIGRYKEKTAVKKFTIKPKKFSNLSFKAGAFNVKDGKPMPGDTPVLVYDGANLLEKSAYTCTVDAGADYTKKSVGVTIKSNSKNYDGEKKINVPVVQIGEGTLITESSISLDKEAYDYTGSAIKPEVTVKIGDATLTKGTDFTVAYSSNTNAGQGFVTVTGKGSYSGKAIKMFTINPVEYKFDVRVSGLTYNRDGTVKNSKITYTGKMLTPKVTVKANVKNAAGVEKVKTLKKNKDYTVRYINNLKAGTGFIEIIGKGNFDGSGNNTFFTINKRSIRSASVVTGGDVVAMKYNKNELAYKLEYSIEYKETVKGSNGNKVKVTFKGGGNFTGETGKKTVLLSKLPRDVQNSIDTSGDDDSGEDPDPGDD